MAGFIAATYCRGIPVIYIPTTLLAMVDAAIGGKTGVNTPQGKNLIGAFKQPDAVFIDPQTLTTLSLEELTNGLVETIKHALILDQDFFYDLAQTMPAVLAGDYSAINTIIVNSINIKRQVVEKDEHENNLRQILNLGHTIAHAIEATLDYKISHGAAVCQGLIIEAIMSNKLGILADKELKTIVNCLTSLPYQRINMTLDQIPTIMQNLSLDKKSIEAVPRFVLLQSMGQVYQQDNHYSVKVSNDIIEASIQQFLQQEITIC